MHLPRTLGCLERGAHHLQISGTGQHGTLVDPMVSQHPMCSHRQRVLEDDGRRVTLYLCSEKRVLPRHGHRGDLGLQNRRPVSRLRVRIGREHHPTPARAAVQRREVELCPTRVQVGYPPERFRIAATQVVPESNLCGAGQLLARRGGEITWGEFDLAIADHAVRSREHPSLRTRA